MKENYFMGMDGFVWFTGVVEDRNDPSKLGRVKVRCLGLHTENKVDIPTADLPWAHVMQSTNTPSMQGLGNTPTFLVEGTDHNSLNLSSDSNTSGSIQVL